MSGQGAASGDSWHTVSVTDKSGKEMWRTVASPNATDSEIRNLRRRLAEAEKNPARYSFLDLASAVILVDGEPLVEMSDEEILAALR